MKRTVLHRLKWKIRILRTYLPELRLVWGAYDPATRRVWIYSRRRFTAVRKKGRWFRDIPSAYELMDYYKDIKDRRKTRRFYRGARRALRRAERQEGGYF